MVFVKGGTYDASKKELQKDDSQGKFYVPTNDRLQDKQEFLRQLVAAPREEAERAPHRPRAIDELKKRELLRLAQQERLIPKPKPRDTHTKAGTADPDPEAAEGGGADENKPAALQSGLCVRVLRPEPPRRPLPAAAARRQARRRLRGGAQEAARARGLRRAPLPRGGPAARALPRQAGHPRGSRRAARPAAAPGERTRVRTSE